MAFSENLDFNIFRNKNIWCFDLNPDGSFSVMCGTMCFSKPPKNIFLKNNCMIRIKPNEGTVIFKETTKDN